MLLGVSRQSVNKWEAERSYPEMDKLLKICDLFDCTLDELVKGDLTKRPQEDVKIPESEASQDVIGYDAAAHTYANKVFAGTLAFVLIEALALFAGGLFPSFGIDAGYAALLALAGLVVGAAILLPALSDRRAFFEEHPFVEDFYDAGQKRQARHERITGIIIGIVFLALAIVLVAFFQTDPWIAGALFVLAAGVGFAIALRSAIDGARCNIVTYNRKALGHLDAVQIEAMDDEQVRIYAQGINEKRRKCSVIMLIATAVALVLLFIPALHGTAWFWLAWVVGGIGCGIVKARHPQSK